MAVAVAVGLVALSGAAGKEGHRLAEDWTKPGVESPQLKKLFIIAIAGLTLERKHFENKFVTYLRTDRIDGVTSHSLVPHLDRIQDRAAILEALEEHGVDGAITVRLVPLDDRTEKEWSAAWNRWLGTAPRIQQLIEQTLPVPEGKTRSYGVEVALWESTGWDLIWAARTDTYRRKKLAVEAGPFVKRTLNALWDAELIR